MATNQDQINRLLEKLELLLKRQQVFNVEINELRRDIQLLKKAEADKAAAESTQEPEAAPGTKPVAKEDSPDSPVTKPAPEIVQPSQREVKKAVVRPINKPKGKSNWEKFIGENLINKIGIVITVIGVAIGAKYSIENNLISPLTRIILGYLAGLGLVGFGIKLKGRYENYSAVLVSGALAIMYFITFAAFSFYDLFPQIVAFVLMLLFTVFGVVASINYNKQIIAHLGLVGAYAVPFLISSESGNAAVLFGYMAIINTGILIISIKKYWKPLFYSSFIFTWLIYISWAVFSFEREDHFTLALVFITIFFLLFYMTFLAYKLIKSEKFKKWDIFLVLLNSFIYYALGYGLLAHHEVGKQLLGAFTLGNALVHFIVSALIYRKKLADRNLFYLVSGMVLIFVTIAIPVQLDGNWVTLLWAFEAALLFWIGRTKHVQVYENLSYPLMILAFLSLLQDWDSAYGRFSGETMPSLLNITFLTSILFIIAFGFILRMQQRSVDLEGQEHVKFIPKMMRLVLPAIFIIALFGAFFMEIDHYWNVQFNKSMIAEEGNKDNFFGTIYNYDLKEFGNIWKFNYGLLFISILAFTVIKKIKNRVLGIVTLTLSVLAQLLFLTAGLYILSELRQSYLHPELSEYYNLGFFNVGIRYVAFAFMAVLMFAMHKLSRQAFMKINFTIPFEVLLHLTILWICSSELLNWMDILGSDQSYKLGLSILWGTYSLLLISLGIWKKRKYLRVAAIVLFGVTLIKLFLYDIASLNTISKTIVFVSLGVLLLIISFLYNKYKDIITDENEK